MSKTIIVVDPPEGWKYGFPKQLPEGYVLGKFNLKQWFLDNGYPVKDIDFAMKYSRYWEHTCTKECQQCSTPEEK